MTDEFQHSGFARVYPRVAARADRRGAREHRRWLLAPARGIVVEIGAGDGRNFAHHPTAVTQVIAIEPEHELRRLAALTAARAPVPVDVRDGHAGALPLADASVDTAVTSLVLCSVTDLPGTLAEIRRVLRPGGQLLFYEHVRSRYRPVALFEAAVTPIWRRLAAGCHLDRDAVAAITAAGFVVDGVDDFTFRGATLEPPVRHVIGRARLAGIGR